MTLHRVSVTLVMLFLVTSLFLAQDYLWPVSNAPESILGMVWASGAVLWFAAIVPSGTGLIGMLLFKRDDLTSVRSISNMVSWRIVSRGTNTDALTRTILATREQMAKTPLFPYVIEVVIDVWNAELPEPAHDLRYIVVPDEYETPNRSLYKARALHYALDASPLPDDAWIVHQDEETHPTPSGIRGIAKMIAEEEESGEYRIGQGAILYHRSWKEHPFLTMADMMRTGDDMARFYLQHRLGITLFGLHGSYIVCKNSLEKSIGFDFGYNGSITEDAFWALVAMERGSRARWVEGFLSEQSTESLKDFIKQRRRWLQGLVKVVLYAPVALKWRIPLALNTTLWVLAPITFLYTMTHFYIGFTHDFEFRLVANTAFAAFILLYLVGMAYNMKEHGIKRLDEIVGWYICVLGMLPLFLIMEVAGVVAAVVKPVKGFEVVKK